MLNDEAVYLREIVRNNLYVVLDKKAEPVGRPNRELVYFATADGRRAAFGDGSMSMLPEMHPAIFHDFLTANLIAEYQPEDSTGRTLYRLTTMGCVASIAASLQLLQ